jgi:hypothetical protein
MKKLFIILALFCLSCQDDITIQLEEEQTKTLEVEIGVWDMLLHETHVVYITEDFYPNEILVFEAWITNDGENYSTNLLTYNLILSDYDGYIYAYDLNEVILKRHGFSKYRSIDYDSEVINRGTLIIKYR